MADEKQPPQDLPTAITPANFSSRFQEFGLLLDQYRDVLDTHPELVESVNTISTQILHGVPVNFEAYGTWLAGFRTQPSASVIDTTATNIHADAAPPPYTPAARTNTAIEPVVPLPPKIPARVAPTALFTQPQGPSFGPPPPPPPPPPLHLHPPTPPPFLNFNSFTPQPPPNPGPGIFLSFGKHQFTFPFRSSAAEEQTAQRQQELKARQQGAVAEQQALAVRAMSIAAAMGASQVAAGMRETQNAIRIESKRAMKEFKEARKEAKKLAKEAVKSAGKDVEKNLKGAAKGGGEGNEEADEKVREGDA
ncbi:hypothetical protein BC938DRAFT_473953 [Jimgerdemannia flammicorona]|uniref:Uncharacterized protein n=1 Tax=Jimgerdemannia flammicorona TaxID=994334 RepID=A0A433Q326_9FUNG|nr:hypothetical protein BC938DRAFT_473953 [Jimgerdemannia flammicorona]